MKNLRLFSIVFVLLFAQQLSNAQGQALTITTNTTLPRAVVGEAMTPPLFQLEATGGTKPYTWSLVPGSPALVGKIAPGLSVTPSGQLVGNATTLQGPVGFKVQVADSSSPKKAASKALIIAVVPATPKISTASMGVATIGVGYSWTFKATDGKLPYTWSNSTALPAGLTLNSTTGVLSGAISSSQSHGNFTLSITVSGSNGKSASGNFVLGINPALAWATQPALPGGKVATTYNGSLTVSGGKSPYSYATKNGSTLPGGLRLNATTGRFSGAPTAAGNFSFTITAKDSGSPATTIERTFTLAIQAYGMSLNGPAAISGQQYQAISPATYSVSGGVAPYSWSTVPALPAALSINASTGLISGNLSAAGGNYSVAVTVKDKGNQTASQNVTITVASAQTLDWVTQPALTGGKVATTYNATLTVSGGKSPYSFATKNGSTLPSGLMLNPTTGLLSGAPTAAGNFSFTITAKDSGSPTTTIERTFTLAVQAYGMSVSGPAAISVQQYQAISPATYSVSGGVAPYSWSTVPALPAALSINAATGVISGNLSAAGGNYSVAVTVKDKGNQTASQNVTLTVASGQTLDWVTQPALPSGKVATTYNATLTVSGGKSPYSFATQNGSAPLPGGMTLNASTGRLSGIPTTAGNFSFTITAKDSASPVNTIERTFTLAIESYGMSVSGPTAIAGTRYQSITPRQFSAIGGKAPYTWSATSLPLSLQLNSTTGILSGNVTTAGGNYTATIKVVDDNKQSVTQNCTIFITDLPVSWITSATLPSAKVSVSYADGNLTATGGKPPYTFSIKAGSTLPGNLTLTSNKIIGTPTTAGTYTFTLNVSDSQSPQQSAERVFNLVVESNFTDMVSVPSGNLPSASGLGNQTVENFQIGRCEVTWGEWKSVRDWAVSNKGYDLAGAGGTEPAGSADNFPVVNVNWYEVMKWCNAKSEKEGKTPFYRNGDGTTYKTGDAVPAGDASANGYRLPSEKEWEWAARGGGSSGNYTYSGSNTASVVAWTLENNTPNGSKAVGTKLPNQLGIYDMSGNVYEWCWDQIRGGGWLVPATAATVADRGSGFIIPSRRNTDLGFRVANSVPPMVVVQGGRLPITSGLANQTVESFQIGRCEVTWAEWQAVRTYAIANGYDLTSVGTGLGSSYPVEQLNWFETVKWCNAKSQMEGKTPVYTISNGVTYKAGEIQPALNASANGYRLPTEAEWEWAARGGTKSQGYAFSGSNDLNLVGWHALNTNGSAKPVGTKAANELQIYDMSGNVTEWCWDVTTNQRITRGGGTIGDATFCGVYTRGWGYPYYRMPNLGFRLACNSGN
jgi:formylglycine-generating enzyme required for sulfatase activity